MTLGRIGRSFRYVPGEDEYDLSVLRGAVSVRDVVIYIIGSKADNFTDKRKSGYGAVQASVQCIRDAGFVLVHTPDRTRKQPSPEHISLVLPVPGEDPVALQDHDWPPRKIADLVACFTGPEMGWES